MCTDNVCREVHRGMKGQPIQGHVGAHGEGLQIRAQHIIHHLLDLKNNNKILLFGNKDHFQDRMSGYVAEKLICGNMSNVNVER